jgi:hypothetical protein
MLPHVAAVGAGLLAVVTASAAIAGAGTAPDPKAQQDHAEPALTARQPDLRLRLQPDGGAPAATPPSEAPQHAGADDASDLARKLQNPVADLVSVPLQFNYDEGFGPNDAGRVTLNIQPVVPFTLTAEWNLISRTILPILWQDSPAPGLDSDAGLGDTTQSFFFSPKQPVDGWIIGFGPALLLPTGTDPQLRSEQLALGPTGVILRQSHGWTYGGLVNHLWGVTQSDDHDEVNSTFVQPFLSYTWPTATTLGVNSEMTYDWNSSELTLPINVQLAQLLKIEGQAVQVQLGGRYYADAPDAGPEWGVRFSITFLFPK